MDIVEYIFERMAKSGIEHIEFNRYVNSNLPNIRTALYRLPNGASHKAWYVEKDNEEWTLLKDILDTDKIEVVNKAGDD